MMARPILLALSLLVVGGFTPLNAGVVLIPGELEEGVLKLPEPPQANLRVQPPPFGYRASMARHDITVEGDLVRVKTTETLKLGGAVKSLVGLIPLTATADLDSASVTINGEPVEVTKLDSDKAGEKLQSFAKTLQSVTILSHSDRPLLLIPSVRFDRVLEVTVEYSQAVTKSQGVNFFNVAMSPVRWTGQPLERLVMGVTVNGGQPIRAILSPTHETSIDRTSDKVASIKVRAQDVIDDADFRLCWVEDKDDLGLRLLTHKADGDDDGYFLLIGNPTGGDDDKAIKKDVTFVLDTSGSMRGEKLEQCRAAIEYCLENLNEGDQFNIITFGSKIESFRNSVVPSSKQNVSDAQVFVEDLVANGRTNINGALKQTAESQTKSSRPQIAIFLTDGTPTAGELVDEKILENFTKANQAGLRVFVLGVGNEVNAHLLDQLAEVSDGLSEYVAPEEEIDQKIAGLYNRLANPVMTDVEVAFGELQTRDVFPRKVPALFRNSQVMLFGRYRDAAEGEIQINGRLADQKRQYSVKAEPASDVNCEFIAPLWASRKIGYLLQEIRLHGDEQELIAEVVRLSKKYGIVTEYTQSLVVAPFGLATPMAATRFGGVRDRAALGADAFRQFESARATKTGVWAVSQARNDKLLQSQLVRNNSVNTFLDRRGQKVQAASTLKQVGARAYYYRNGVWEDGADAGKRRTRKVKAFSKEYFELLKNEDFAKAQQLGGSVSLNIGEERVVVEPVPGAKPPVGQQQQLVPQQQLPLNQFRNQVPLQQIDQRQIPGLNNKVNRQQIPNLQLQQQAPNLPPRNQKPAAPKKKEEPKKDQPKQKEER